MITYLQCRMARAALRIGVRDLAEKSGVSSMTISRFENCQSGGQAETLRKLQSAFENAGIKFIIDDQGNVGVLVNNEQRN